MNSSIFWKSIQRSQKKRKTIRLKKNASQRTKPAVKKSNRVSRYPQKDLCKEVNQPSITTNSPLTMDETLPRARSLTTAHAPPILLDKSTVPRGQMLPVCQDQFLSASFQFVENNWINSTTAIMNATSGVFTSHHTFLPSSSSGHMLWDAASHQVDPVTFLSGHCGQAYTPPEKTEVCYTDLPQVSQPDIVSVEDFTSQLLIPPCKLQSELSSSDDLTLAVSEALCDSRLFPDCDNCSSPLTDSQCDVVSPLWLDLLLDSSNLCFPDPNLVDFVLSPETGPD